MKTLKFLLCSMAVLSLLSCKKDEKDPEPAPSPVNLTPYYVRMTDAPGAYSAVNIDLKAVEVISNGAAITLNTNPGIYNLLDFTNGNDTLIATGALTGNKVEQIRLILGPNNSIVTIGGVSYPLSTPSAQQSGLKLQVHHQLQAGVAYMVLLDFDASMSIVTEGNGGYSLKPVIRTIEAALSGSVKGKISQAGVSTVVTLTDGTKTYSAIVNANGEFMIAGVPPGVYTLTATPVAPYNSATVTNITVVVGVSTDVGVITI